MINKVATLKLVLKDLNATRALGLALGKAAKKSFLLLTLEGGLGVGKTTLCKSIVEGRLGEGLMVQSPTFNLLNIYENSEGRAYHYDLYRVKSKEELLELGLEEALKEDNLVLFEWPEHALSFLKSVERKIEIKLFQHGEERIVELNCNISELQKEIDQLG